MEKIVNDDMMIRRMNLDSKYSLEHVGIVEKQTSQEGSIDITYSNGTKEYIMTNGMRKRVYEDGLIIL